MDFRNLEKELDYSFKNKELLKTALTHTSYANEHKVTSNEKLEYLGDAILEFVVSKYLYKNFQRLKEGEMTKVRATVVCEQSLYLIAIKHKFSDFLYLGRSENANNGAKKPAILADSVEAVIAAIYLDSDLETAERFIIKNLTESIELASKTVGEKDYKTVLQEKLQVNGTVSIKYNLLNEEGPDHNKTFTAEVTLEGKQLAIGIGKTKKMAEMDAAKRVLENMKKEV